MTPSHLWGTKTPSAVSARRAADSETLKSWAGWNIAAPRAPQHGSAAHWYATEVHPRPILMMTASAGASSFSETAQTPSEWTITSTVSPPEA